MNTVSKQIAIEAMLTGKQVRHRFFDPTEWITMRDNKIITEAGLEISQEMFWGDRKIDAWLTDWEIIEDSNIKTAGIVADNYKLNKFKKELIKAGFTDFEVFPFVKETSTIKVKVPASKTREIQKICTKVEMYFKRFAAWCLLFCLADTSALDKIYRQNNSTKPLLVAGAVN